MPSKRPGLPSVALLPPALRQVGEPLIDLVARITGAASGLKKIATLDRVKESAAIPVSPLGGGATLAQVITRVNELHEVIKDSRVNEKELRVKTDELINRLQED